jgi:hypothetical protein
MPSASRELQAWVSILRRTWYRALRPCAIRLRDTGSERRLETQRRDGMSSSFVWALGACGAGLSISLVHTGSTYPSGQHRRSRRTFPSIHVRASHLANTRAAAWQLRSGKARSHRFGADRGEREALRRVSPRAAEWVTASCGASPLRIPSDPGARSGRTRGRSPSSLGAKRRVQSVLGLSPLGGDLKLPRFAGRVVKAYAAFFFSKQSSNASGAS